MDWLGRGITDHSHLPVISASLKGCKHTQPVLVMSLSKCRDMSSLPLFLSPLWFVYRPLSPAGDGQTLPLLDLTKCKESVCHPTWPESSNPEFSFLPLSSALSPPSHHISAVNLLLYTCLSFLISFFFFFFWNILLLSEWKAQGCALIRSLCSCYLSENIKDRCNANAFKHQLLLLRIPNQMKKQLLLDFHPFLYYPLTYSQICIMILQFKDKCPQFLLQSSPLFPKIWVLITSFCICARF